jgi:diguanylate cyclase (GGDEF)-like protein
MSAPEVPGVHHNRSWRPSPAALTADPVIRQDFRLAIADHDIPPILRWAGLLVVVLSPMSYLMEQDDGLAVHVADISVALLLIGAGLWLPRSSVRPRLVPPIFAALITLLVVALLFEMWLLPSALSMAYVLVVMCAFGPSTLAWRPFVIASAVMISVSAVVAHTWAGHNWLDWTFAAIGSVLIGALLLRARLRSIDALADATALVQRLATTDELTGALNRHGLAFQLDALAANARRLGQLIFVAFVDIDGLKRANDEYGHDFGDDVIVSVAQAVMGSVRQGDLVARWGGDELLVVGLGAAPEESAFSGRLHANIVASGIDLLRWPGAVSIGMAYGSPASMEIDDLITAADADMYQRRHER